MHVIFGLFFQWGVVRLLTLFYKRGWANGFHGSNSFKFQYSVVRGRERNTCRIETDIAFVILRFSYRVRASKSPQISRLKRKTIPIDNLIVWPTNNRQNPGLIDKTIDKYRIVKKVEIFLKLRRDRGTIFFY